MNKLMLGAAAAALTVAAAAPAQAQFRDRYDRRDGLDTGDIVTGIAVLGGIAAVLSALDRDGGRYGYDNRYRHRDSYSAAVSACGYEAERYGRGRVRITDVDRRSNDRYEVEGVIENGHGGYDTRYDRGYDRRYDAREYSRDYGERFTCVAYGNGRIAQFRMRDGYASRVRPRW